MILKTLYKKDSRGNVIEWSIYVKGSEYWAEYGIQGGKRRIDKPTKCVGKNIGKKNETTPEHQALKEASSKVDKKITQGYVENVNNIDKKRFSPMLAHEYTKHSHKLPEVVNVSPKLDGIRCYFMRNEGAYYGNLAFSRNGKIFTAAKYLNEELQWFFDSYPHLILDGELYNHKYKDDFNKIVSMVRRTKHFTEKDWKLISEHLQFHIFDVVIENAGYQYRRTFLESCIKPSKNIIIVDDKPIEQKDIDLHHDKFVEQGYEGIMARDPLSKYELKRSYGLQKYKKFIDEEFEIIGFEEGSGNWSGVAKKLLFRNNDGEDFDATLKGTREYCEKVLLDFSKICGKFATVKYQNRTPRPKNKPRFGVVTAIRDYE